MIFSVILNTSVVKYIFLNKRLEKHLKDSLGDPKGV